MPIFQVVVAEEEVRGWVLIKNPSYALNIPDNLSDQIGIASTTEKVNLLILSIAGGRMSS